MVDQAPSIAMLGQRILLRYVGGAPVVLFASGIPHRSGKYITEPAKVAGVGIMCSNHGNFSGRTALAIVGCLRALARRLMNNGRGLSFSLGTYQVMVPY